MRWLGEETGIVPQPVNQLWRSRLWPFMLCTPDGLGEDSDGPVGVECKNVRSQSAHEWQDGPPIHYRIQCQASMAVSGLSRWYIAALIGGNSFSYWVIERDEDLIALIVEKIEEFWTRVTLRRPPDPDGSEATTNAIREHLRANRGTEVERDATTVGPLLQARRALQAEAKVIAERLAAVDNQLKVLAGEAEVVTVDGRVAYTFRETERKGYEVKPSVVRTLRVREDA